MEDVGFGNGRYATSLPRIVTETARRHTSLAMQGMRKLNWFLSLGTARSQMRLQALLEGHLEVVASLAFDQGMLAERARREKFESKTVNVTNYERPKNVQAFSNRRRDDPPVVAHTETRTETRTESPDFLLYSTPATALQGRAPVTTNSPFGFSDEERSFSKSSGDVDCRASDFSSSDSGSSSDSSSYSSSD